MKRSVIALLSTLALCLMPSAQRAGADSSGTDSSSNAGRIWFLRRPGITTMDVWSMNSDGSDKQKKFSRPTGVSDITFTSDFNTIIYVSETSDGLQIFSRKIGTTTDVALTGSANNIEPTVSPDGKKIAFASDRNAGGPYSIWVMNIDGSNKHAISFGSGTDHYPQWSQTGSYLYWSSGVNTPSKWDIWRGKSTDGSNASRVVRSTITYKAIAGPMRSDGKRMLYATNTSGSYDIYSMNPDGSDKQLKIGGSRNEGFSGTVGGSPGGFAYSPDGTKIVYSAIDADNNSDIWKANSDGSHKSRLTQSTEDDAFPIWRIPLLPV